MRKTRTTLSSRLAALAIGVAVSAGGAVLPQVAKAGTEHIHFGIVPQQSATRLARIWLPFVRELSSRTGVSIEFVTTKDIPSFERCLAKGAYQLAYMNPYHYTVFHKSVGYEAFARQAGKRLQGLIVTRADSPHKSLDDLAGKDLAFPSPAAFGASVLPRAEMRARGLAIRPSYVKSHDSVYRAVAAGLFPAGGGVKRTLAAADEALRHQLRVIYHTKAYTPHAFAASPRVPAPMRAKILAAMLSITAEKPELTKGIGMAGLMPARDSDWDDVRALGLSPEETKIAKQGEIKCLSD